MAYPAVSAPYGLNPQILDHQSNSMVLARKGRQLLDKPFKTPFKKIYVPVPNVTLDDLSANFDIRGSLSFM